MVISLLQPVPPKPELISAFFEPGHKDELLLIIVRFTGVNSVLQPAGNLKLEKYGLNPKECSKIRALVQLWLSTQYLFCCKGLSCTFAANTTNEFTSRSTKTI